MSDWLQELFRTLYRHKIHQREKNDLAECLKPSGNLTLLSVTNVGVFFTSILVTSNGSSGKSSSAFPVSEQLTRIAATDIAFPTWLKDKPHRIHQDVFYELVE